MKLLKIPLFLFVMIIVLVLLAGGLAVGIAVLNTAPDTIPAEGALFQIEKGENSESVFIRLENEKLIRSSLLIRLIAKLYNTEAALKSGIYKIMPGQSTLDVHNLFVSGRQEMTRVTIKEGWTLLKIARELESQRIVSQASFLAAAASPQILSEYGIPGKTAEGFLFPETYYLARDISAETVIRLMLDTFFKKLAALAPESAQLSRVELNKTVIVASIIEREYRNESEAPVIASVFYNRLAINQRLESCATVAYVITDILGRPHPDVLTAEDLKIQSPYNTYVSAGLPPGPIGNPGSTALIGAFYPIQSNYLYFVLKDPETGVHEFSENFTQHVNAKNLYLKSN